MKIDEEKIKTEQIYKTTDFSLASYLFYKGFTLWGVEKVKDQKKAFLFIRESGLDESIEEFYRRKALVEPESFLLTVKMLKTRLYNNEQSL